MVFENVKGGTTAQAGGGHRHCHCHPHKAGLSLSPVSFDCKWQKPSWTRQDKRGLAGLTNRTQGGRDVRDRALECLPHPPKVLSHREAHQMWRLWGLGEDWKNPPDGGTHFHLCLQYFANLQVGTQSHRSKTSPPSPLSLCRA